MSRGIIKIDYQCDNNCFFCHSNPKRKFGVCSLNDTFDKIEALKKAGVNEVYISGGEPLLSKNLLKVIEPIKKRGMKFGLITNSKMFADENVVNTLAKAGLTYVHTTLLGPNSKIHDSITRTPGSFDKTLKGIKNILKKGIKLDVNCVVVKQNLNHLIKIADLASQSGVKSFRFSFVEPLSKEDDYIPQLSLAAEKIKEAIQNNKGLMKIGFDSLPLCISNDFEEYRENLLTKDINFISECYEKGIFPADFGNKIKTKKCSPCSRKHECEGVFEKYTEIYGDKELKPFS